MGTDATSSVKRDEVLRVVYPDGTPKDMLESVYGRPCQDCGRKIRTSDVHLHMKKRPGKKPLPRVVCPICAPTRGEVRDLEVKKGRRKEDERPASPARPPIIVPGRRILRPSEVEPSPGLARQIMEAQRRRRK